MKMPKALFPTIWRKELMEVQADVWAKAAGSTLTAAGKYAEVAKE